MRQAIIVIFIIWLSIIALVSCTRASDIGGWNKFMADQVYSVYLERANYLHEVDSGRVEYNSEIDKGLGIRLDDVVLHGNRPDYRNPHVSNLFKSLNFVEKEGGGLKDIVYPEQIKKGLTINEYLEVTKTTFELLGYIKDVAFAKYLTENIIIDNADLFLLDKIVSGKNNIGSDISKEDALNLRRKGYIDISGTRYQKANLSKSFAKNIKKIGVRTRIGGIDRERYEEHIIKHIREHGKIFFFEVKDICKDKSDTWCSNTLRSMRKKNILDLIKVEGKTKSERYHILL